MSRLNMNAPLMLSMGAAERRERIGTDIVRAARGSEVTAKVAVIREAHAWDKRNEGGSYLDRRVGPLGHEAVQAMMEEADKPLVLRRSVAGPGTWAGDMDIAADRVEALEAIDAAAGRLLQCKALPLIHELGDEVTTPEGPEEGMVRVRVYEKSPSGPANLENALMAVTGKGFV